MSFFPERYMGCYRLLATYASIALHAIVYTLYIYIYISSTFTWLKSINKICYQLAGTIQKYRRQTTVTQRYVTQILYVSTIYIEIHQKVDMILANLIRPSFFRVNTNLAQFLVDEFC